MKDSNRASINARVLRRFLVAISAPPVRFDQYLAMTQRKLEMGLRELKRNVSILKKALRADDSGMGYVDRQFRFSVDDLERFILEEASKFVDRVGRLSQLNSLRDAPRYLGSEDDIRLLARLAEQSESEIERVSEDGMLAPNLRDAYLGINRVAKDVVARFRDLGRKLQQKINFERGEVPQHEKVEKLYHASVDARSLYNNGFSLTRPAGGLGLGGSVADKAGNDAVSFTYDLKYALEISRWFKEMAHAARGDLKASTILRMSEREGVAEQTLRYFDGTTQVGDPFTGGRTEIRVEGGKWKVVQSTFDRATNQVVEEPGDLNEIFKTTHDVYGLYRAFVLTDRSHRDNPVAMATDRVLDRMQSEGINPRDIGVIVAEVDMTDPDIKHIPAEREFRVPPKAIKRVVRFLGEETRMASLIALKVAARYQEKKKVPKANGKGTTEVYVYSERQVQNRNREKAKRLQKFSGKVEKLRSKVKADLDSEDRLTRLVALAVALIDETHERVGNEESAKGERNDSGEPHYGVTGWKKRHVSLGSGAATIRYVGKSGVKHEKTVSTPYILSALRRAHKEAEGKDGCLFAWDGGSVTAAKVNEFLRPFEITAKDLRGLAANSLMQKALKKARKGPLPKDRKEREEKLKAEFKEALEAVSDELGHEASTLKSQYLAPSMEGAYIKDGTIIDKLHEKKARAA